MNSSNAESRAGSVSRAQVTLEINMNDSHYLIARTRDGVHSVSQAGPLVVADGVIDVKTFDGSLLILHG